ncbi:MAG: hypothetical protein C4524_05665 [Candidatus Zixiibacteriota bacterium]|nr:MAG: hypothetical protein C4524_05665 [candidate division Zixibacteria bacterium]
MPGPYLEANLQRLAARQPDLAQTLARAYRPDYPEIRATRDGLPVPVVERKSLHSPYDPRAEAAKWVASLNLSPAGSALCLVSGLGFGYHLEALAGVVPPERWIVVEPDAALAAAALAHRPPDSFPDGFHLIVETAPVMAYQEVLDASPSEPVRIEHPASVRLHPDFFATFQGLFRAQAAARRGGYKILLVSPVYGGSLPVTAYVQRALTALGHRCEVLDNSVFHPGLQALEAATSHRDHRRRLLAHLTALLAETVTARALDMRADLVLGLAQSPFTVEVLGELKKAGIRTAFWFIEDGDLFQYWTGFAPQFDHYFVIQKGEFLDRVKAAGCPHPCYLPLAADPEVHRPLELSAAEQEEFGSDLSHVGAGYHNRRQVFARLLDYDFKLWGNDWDHPGPLAGVLQRGGERLDTEASVRVFNATRLNLNLHSSTHHPGVNPFGDYVNPRTFEIAACGAFQLVDERRLLPEMFQPGEEIATFQNASELRDRIDHYLAHPLERIQIAQAGRRRVLREHTYRHRLLEMLGAIAGRHPDWQPRAGGLPTAEEIIAQAGPESELGKIMQRFTGRGSLTLDDVAGEIEHSEGNLKRTEALILLLNEFRRWGLEKGVL